MKILNNSQETFLAESNKSGLVTVIVRRVNFVSLVAKR
jgi:hypothetical protein